MGDDFGVAGFALVLRLYHYFLWIGASIQFTVVGWTNRFMIAAAYGRLAYDNDVAGHQA
jgi:hypothetical protein